MKRHDGRAPGQLRTVKIKRRFTRPAPGSVLFQAGETIVLCTASIDNSVPAWMVGKGKGWITAEYGMLPGSTQPRKKRDAGKPDGRSVEIQRLIGRSLRAVTNLEALGERSVNIDCDVLQADGGTRTASITGALIALVDALATIRKELPYPEVYPLRDSVAAVSVGMVDGHAVLDLDYHEDVDAEVDMNLVMTGSGQFVELQGTGEEATFSETQLTAMLKLGKSGIRELTEQQRESLGKLWPF